MPQQDTNAFTKMRRTPLFELHHENGGSITPWGSMEIPSHYRSILDEHEAAQKHLGLFDLGYRNYLRLQGSEALVVLNELTSVDLENMETAMAWEVPFVYPDGTLVDLVKVAREGEQSFLLVFQNATNAGVDWLKQQSQGYSCYIDELTIQYAWVGLAGARANEFFANYFSGQKASMTIYQRREVLIEGVAVDLWKLGEDYYEMVCQPELLLKVVYSWWQRAQRPTLCGWASYENWRLENGIPRWGIELKAGVSPYEALLDKKIDLDKAHFMGKDALQKANHMGLNHMLVYFYLDALRMPRENSPIYFQDKMVGKVVSGGFSTRLKRPIGSGWVSAAVDFDSLEVEIRRSRFPLKIKNPPFC